MQESVLNPSADLVNRLWRLCSLLRKDGITYQQYVTELSQLLFLKMMHEFGAEKTLPAGSRWSDLLGIPNADKLRAYRGALHVLGRSRDVPTVIGRIFAKSSTAIREPDNLAKLIMQIDSIGWLSESRNSFGDLYEGILERNAEEAKRGAGQYFTPRVLVDVIVDLLQPVEGEVVQDPAAGTGGFLTAADRYARTTAGPCRASGMENVPETYRLLLMNLYLHGIDTGDVLLGDTLSDNWRGLPPADVILTNPPFGPAGGRPSRSDLTVTGTVSSFAPPFVEHCVRSLKAGGRAAIVVPDSILNEEGRSRALRTFLMSECELHTVLRLPSGIFYAQNVRTNVLFLNRRADGAGTSAVWFYDLRADMPAFGKSTPLAIRHFDEFARFYGGEPNGSDRPADGASDDRRARRVTRDEIGANDDDLDYSCLREGDEAAEDAANEPQEMLAAAQGYLSQAQAHLQALVDELDRYEDKSTGDDV